jgi:hypothetical protein
VSLPIEEYHKALDAHKKEYQVTCVGVLKKEGHHMSLQDPRLFKVLRTDKDEASSDDPQMSIL